MVLWVVSQCAFQAKIQVLHYTTHIFLKFFSGVVTCGTKKIRGGILWYQGGVVVVKYSIAVFSVLGYAKHLDIAQANRAQTRPAVPFFGQVNLHIMQRNFRARLSYPPNLQNSVKKQPCLNLSMEHPLTECDQVNSWPKSYLLQ